MNKTPEHLAELAARRAYERKKINDLADLASQESPHYASQVAAQLLRQAKPAQIKRAMAAVHQRYKKELKPKPKSKPAFVPYLD